MARFHIELSHWKRFNRLCLVVGGITNDKVFNAVELFFDGLINKTETINRLRYEKPNLQICFRTDIALSLLHFEGSEIL